MMSHPPRHPHPAAQIPPDLYVKRGSVARQAFTVLFVIAVIASNVLADALPIHDQTTGEISRRHPQPFTPAAYVFSIWMLIYAGLAAYAVYQALPAQRYNRRLEAIARPFWMSSLANVAWMVLWHHERIPASMLAMLVLVGSLYTIYRRLSAPSSGHERPSRVQQWCVDQPFRIYFAWVTVAALANLSVLVDTLGLRPAFMSPEGWAVAMIALATLIATVVGSTKRDAAYLAVLVWALIGIGVENGFENEVSTAALTGVLICAMLMVRSLLLNRAQSAQPPFGSARISSV